MSVNVPSFETGYKAQLAAGLGADDTEIYISGDMPKVTANGILMIDRGTSKAEIIIYTGSDAETKKLTGVTRGLPPVGNPSLVGDAEYAFSHDSEAEIACVSNHYAYEIVTQLAEDLDAEFIANVDRLKNKKGMFEIKLAKDLELYKERTKQLFQSLFNAFATQINSDFDNFVGTQYRITAKVNDGDDTQIDISSGEWLDGTTPREYAGITALAVTLDQTTYYELQTITGTLITNTTGFTGGNFPICKVIADATQVTSIKNYGAAYQVSAETIISFAGATNFTYTNGLLTSFDDADSVTWTLTYDEGGNVETLTDGTTIYTISRDATGNLNGLAIS